MNEPEAATVGVGMRSISEMEAGFFWTQPDCIGTPNEESAAMALGMVAPLRKAELMLRLAEAKQKLWQATPGGIDHGFRTAIN
jgi:hypothetical protein